MHLLLALLIACADPAKNVTPAEVAAPEAPKAEAPAAPAHAGHGAATPAAPTYAGKALTPTGSVGFTGAKVTGSHDGTFGTWSGALYLDGEKVTGLTVEAQVTTLATDSAKLDDHLRSPDFFEVTKWPTATFKSTSITEGAPADSKLAGANATVTGDLTIRDVTKSVTFPAALEVGQTEVKANTEFFINRKDFGIVYPGKPDNLIKDEVVLRVALTAPRG